MSKLFKTLIATVPAVAILFFYTVIKQHEVSSKIELESAKFDTEFAHLMRDEKLPVFNESFNGSDFWAEREKKAQEVEKEKEEELKRQKEKVKKFEEEFEKVMNETEVKK